MTETLSRGDARAVISERREGGSIAAIMVDNLVKTYGGVRAVDGVSFRVERGEVFGMLGPNGAGKTTTTEILEGLRSADDGRIEVLGVDVRRDPARVKPMVGVALQTTTLLTALNPRELIELFGSFYAAPLPADKLLTRMGLQEKAAARVETLSGGQQQRLSVALALVNDPQLVFLDEPTTGLDPQARRSLWDVIEEMRAAGKTVFLTTHYMEEAERLCDRIAIMDHGRILALDTPANLVRSNFSERAIQFAAPEGVEADVFADLPGVARAGRAEDATGEIVLYTDSVEHTLGPLLERGRQQGLALDDVHVRRATLEDVFLKLTGRSMRD